MRPMFRASRTCLKPLVGAILGLSIWPVAVWAQAVRPDAGTIQRDLQQRPLEVPRAGPQLQPAPARPAQQGDAVTRFRVTALKFSGNTVFASDLLLALVQDELVNKRSRKRWPSCRRRRTRSVCITGIAVILWRGLISRRRS